MKGEALPVGAHQDELAVEIGDQGPGRVGPSGCGDRGKDGEEEGGDTEAAAQQKR